MSLINDVKEEISALPVDGRSLRKFGITIGGIFIIISIFLFLSNFSGVIFWFLISSGMILTLFGWLLPGSLHFAYLVWMSVAIFLGWFASRIILIILFYTIITLIGGLAKIFGKKFIDLNWKSNLDTYWIKRESHYKSNYTKLY